MRTRDLPRQVLNLILAIAQPVVSALTFPQGQGSDSQLFDAANDPPIVPAGYAFAIWGLIFAATIAYGVYQALPSRREDPLLRAIGWWTAAAFLFTSGWLLLARENLIWMTFFCIVMILIFLVPPFLRTHRETLGTAARWLVRAPLAMFTGWITIATFANLTTALRSSGFSVVMTEGYTIAMLGVAAVVAMALLIRSRGDLIYLATLVWALVAIAIDNRAGQRNAVAVTALILIVVLAATARRTRPQESVQ